MKFIKYLFSVTFLCATTCAFAETDQEMITEIAKKANKKTTETIETVSQKGNVFVEENKKVFTPERKEVKEAVDQCPFAFFHGPVKWYRTKKENFLDKLGKIYVCTQEYKHNLSEVIWDASEETNNPKETVENISSESKDISSEEEQSLNNDQKSEVVIVDDTLTEIKRKINQLSKSS